MPYLNSTTLMGNLVAAPVQRSTPGGSVATFTVAIQSGGFEGKPSRADFIDCEAWSGWAENLCRTAHKGALVLVMGRLAQERWQDSATGKTRSRVKLVAQRAFHLQRPEREAPAVVVGPAPHDAAGEDGGGHSDGEVEP